MQKRPCIFQTTCHSELNVLIHSPGRGQVQCGATCHMPTSLELKLGKNKTSSKFPSILSLSGQWWDYTAPGGVGCSKEQHVISPPGTSHKMHMQNCVYTFQATCHSDVNGGTSQLENVSGINLPHAHRHAKDFPSNFQATGHSERNSGASQLGEGSGTAQNNLPHAYQPILKCIRVKIGCRIYKQPAILSSLSE